MSLPCTFAIRSGAKRLCISTGRYRASMRRGSGERTIGQVWDRSLGWPSKPAALRNSFIAIVTLIREFDTRYAYWAAALLLLTAAPAFAGFAGLGWELFQMAGLIGGLACIALCGSPIRPRDSVPPTLLSLRLHTLIGWAALMAVIVHVGGLILAD